MITTCLIASCDPDLLHTAAGNSCATGSHLRDTHINLRAMALPGTRRCPVECSGRQPVWGILKEDERRPAGFLFMLSSLHGGRRSESRLLESKIEWFELRQIACWRDNTSPRLGLVPPASRRQGQCCILRPPSLPTFYPGGPTCISLRHHVHHNHTLSDSRRARTPQSLLGPKSRLTAHLSFPAARDRGSPSCCCTSGQAWGPHTPWPLASNSLAKGGRPCKRV